LPIDCGAHYEASREIQLLVLLVAVVIALGTGLPCTSADL